METVGETVSPTIVAIATWFSVSQASQILVPVASASKLLQTVLLWALIKEVVFHVQRRSLRDQFHQQACHHQG